MKIALAMIVKGSDEEAEVLSRCLSYASKYVDGIFITITQPNEKVKQAAELFGATVSHFDWVNDFAAARNFNFSQVPKEYDYIFWMDADDVPRGLEKLKDTIERHPADCYSMFYLYHFDEYKNPTVVHPKTRVIKNDNCVEWRGQLHEDLMPLRDVKTYHIEKIDILHLSDEKRYESSKERNLEVAKGQLEKEPNDPRALWNMGNSLKALGKNEESLEMFDKFLKLSNSDDEKYIVYLRKAEILWQLNKKQEAIEQARYGIGTKPNFPDGYFLLGSLYYETKQWDKAIEMYLTGIVKPKPYHKFIVYNPRDYDYVPMMNLAKCYFQISRPDNALVMLEGCIKIYPEDKNIKGLIKLMKKEKLKFDKVLKALTKLVKIKDLKKLKTELDNLPDEVKAHPGICAIRNTHFIKQESSGKDMVIYCGYTAEEWTPDTVKKTGIGGSEEAVLHLSQRFANAGWNVTVLNNCGYKEQIFQGSEEADEVDSSYSVTYKPFWMWNPKDKQDVTILWRTPKYADWEINSPKLYVDMHDVIPAGEFTEERVKKIDKIFIKSKFQRDLFPQVPDEKFEIIPNGIDPEKFEEQTERDPMLIVNTSAPNRGLSVLPQIFKLVKAEVPEAKMKWAYGWGTFDSGFQGNLKVQEWKEQVKKELKEAGIEELGRLSHDEVAKLYLQANVYAYPSGFAEIDCISVTKAMAAGAIPVTTDFAALGEKAGHGGFFIHSDLTSEDWAKPYQHDFAIVDPAQIKQTAEYIIKLLKNPPDEFARQSMRDWAKKNYSWEEVGNRWLKILSQD